MIIALVGLTVVNIPFLTVMGLAAAGTVAVAVLIALTLLPALLGFAGDRVARLNRVLGYRPGGGGAGPARHEHPLGALRHRPPAAGAARRPHPARRGRRARPRT